MKGIAGLGIANVDIIFSNACRMPRLGEEIYTESCCCRLGGGPVATLIQLTRLGVPVRLATFIGTGKLSRYLEEELKKNAVDYCNMLETKEEDPVTLSCVVSSKQDRGIISYRPDNQAFHVNVETMCEFYKESKIAFLSLEQRKFCRQLKQEGCIIVLDSAWSDDMNLEWYYDTFPYVDYFIPNELEAMKITETKSGEEALDVLGRYLPIPIVKKGRAGCIYKEDNRIIRIASVPVKHIDSTGAGDAFAAGFMYGIYHGYQVGDCIRMGNIMGGNAVTDVGCLSAQINEEKLLRKFREVYGG